MLSKHFWRPGYCNPMHICFQWCNRYDRHGNIRRCRLQRHTVCVCCFYPQHLRQTLGRSPAALAVGTDMIPLVTESHQRSAHFGKGHIVFYEYCCWPGGAFCIRSLRWLFLAFFHADGLTFQRLTRGTGTRHLQEATVWQRFRAFKLALCEACYPHVQSICSSVCGFHYCTTKPQAAWRVLQTTEVFIDLTGIMAWN